LLVRFCEIFQVKIATHDIDAKVMNTPTTKQLPLPNHFDTAKVGEVWRVPYQDRAAEAKDWAKKHNIQPAAEDKTRICLLLLPSRQKIIYSLAD
jgi:hypothetical protein